MDDLHMSEWGSAVAVLQVASAMFNCRNFYTTSRVTHIKSDLTVTPL